MNLVSVPKRAPHPDIDSAARADVAQLVERRLPKPKVAGSRPVVRLAARLADARSVIGAGPCQSTVPAPLPCERRRSTPQSASLRARQCESPRDVGARLVVEAVL